MGKYKRISLKLGNYFFHFFDKPFLVNTSKFNKKVSIIVITHNALKYIKLCFKSLEKTDYPNYEIVVVDNASKQPGVRRYLKSLYKTGKINKLLLSKKNNLWAKGNNMGVSLSSDDSEYVLLLNSDVEIKDKDWLKVLVALAPEKGTVSFGCARWYTFFGWWPDGWCSLCDRNTFLNVGGIDEKYKFWGAYASLLLRVIKNGYIVRGIFTPEKYVLHYWGKSLNKSMGPECFSFNEKMFRTIVSSKKLELIGISGRNIFIDNKVALSIRNVKNKFSKILKKN
jgi:GT2 family glycosyltransferase